ncbi:MAG: class I SAM-dependent methyltransferase [Litoreibacter sp.]
MPLTRVHIALEQELLDVSSGVGVLNAPADMNLENAVATQAYYPAHAALLAREIPVTPTAEGTYENALVQCHRTRAVSFDSLREAVLRTSIGGTVAINGDKTDGIEAIVRELRKRFVDVEVFSKAHGKLAWFSRPKDLPSLDDWEAKPFDTKDGFRSFPGIFSSDGIDKGSEILVQHLPELKGRVADLGAGWGFLSRHILLSKAVSQLDMVEADYNALHAAKTNVLDARANHHWADALNFDGKGYDAVVMNPPFHISRKPDPALGQGFIRKAAKLLAPKGVLWMVANRNLPYESVLHENFLKLTTIAQTGGFKVIQASQPKPARPAR